MRDGALEWFIAEYEGKEKIKVTNSGSGNFDEFKVCHCHYPLLALRKRLANGGLLCAADARCSRKVLLITPALQASLSDERISFGFLRMISGDQVRPPCRSAALSVTMDANDTLAPRLLAFESRWLQESKRVKFVFYVFVGASANVMAKVCHAASAYLLTLMRSAFAVARQRPQARRGQGACAAALLRLPHLSTHPSPLLQSSSPPHSLFLLSLPPRLLGNSTSRSLPTA